MTATSESTASSASTAEIAQAAESWARTATSQAEAYASLATRVSRDMPAALVRAGLDVNAATDMTEEMRVDLSNMAELFRDLARQARNIGATREDILDLIAKAKSNSTERTFRIGA